MASRSPTRSGFSWNMAPAASNAAPTASIAVPAEDFGFLGHILAIDQPASSAQTRALLGWQPVQPGLIEGLDKGHYFA
jgi:hypothetical protein